MNIKAMTMFLSEDNIKKHIEHLNEQRLKLSILEKSAEGLKGKSLSEIIKLDLNKDIKTEAINLLWYIKTHELFFDSFSEEQKRCKSVERYSGSAQSFGYYIYTEAMKYNIGFLFVYLNCKGRPVARYSDGFDGAFVKYEPRLVIDLYEHAYFADYGFKKDKFLSSAICRLDLSKLS